MVLGLNSVVLPGVEGEELGPICDSAAFLGHQRRRVHRPDARGDQLNAGGNDGRDRAQGLRVTQRAPGSRNRESQSGRQVPGAADRRKPPQTGQRATQRRPGYPSNRSACAVLNYNSSSHQGPNHLNLETCLGLASTSVWPILAPYRK
ncbi:hypothetical protein D3C76_1191010 [compost metagenome]